MPRLPVQSLVYALATGCLTLLALFAPAAQAAAGATPADLDAWSDWVVRDIEDYGCPILYNNASRRCGYPARLDLALDSDGGTFTQTWRVYRKALVHLPGNREYWPLDVLVDDRPAAVIDSNGLPSITLGSGEHTVRGAFHWRHLPAALVVPPESGLVTLRLAGAPVAQPDIRNGQLWLSDNRTSTETARRVDIKVFRTVTDEVPLGVTTRLVLEVSGEQRELSLTGALLRGFAPVAIRSQLPARLDGAGQLLLKVRAGRWVVDIDSRLYRETLALALESFPAPWPATELWVFEARPNLRMLKVTSPPGIDASQSPLPEEWKQFPAYLMQAGTTMAFEQIRRGDRNPSPTSSRSRASCGSISTVTATPSATTSAVPCRAAGVSMPAPGWHRARSRWTAGRS